MNTFDLEIFDGHAIFIDGDNRILLDTGAPVTIHEDAQLRFNNREYEVLQNYSGLTVEEISRLLNSPITTLLGANVLRDYQILIDYENKRLIFSNDPIEFSGTEVETEYFMGIPIIEVKIGGNRTRVFLDTGAKISYAAKELTENFQCIGQESDFYPGVGEFQTDCYIMDTEIGNTTFSVKYGNLPPMLQMSLMLAKTKGIIGYDFFNNFKVLLDIEGGRLVYKKN